ncbi:MAG: serine/threonine protein kinase [Myxococcales bacterium]|nr:serine/threonine protein kinase [Myxococcales bacterium]
MSTTPVLAVGPGSMLGRYQVLSHLASGGMAEIFLARATGLQGFERYVVVKCIKPEHARDERFVEMFIDEARLSAQLHHQNIAQVYDIGQEGGAYYFAMEYVHGENVRELLHRVAIAQARVPLEHALTIVTAAAAGLHYAHDKRGSDRRPLDIVHRDVSPSNIIVAFDGAVKVVDFGIAKAALRMTETRSGTLKGKIAYMSPEQCRSEPLDRRSDVFALGIVLYELTTVTRLFKGDSDYVTMNKIVTGEIPPPSTVRADYPPALEAIVMRALAVDPAARFPSAGAMLDALVGFCQDEKLSTSAIGLARYARELFGERPEPWMAGDAAISAHHLAAASASSTDTATAAPAGSGLTPATRAGGATAAAAAPGSAGSLLLSAELRAPVEARPRRAALWLGLAAVAGAALVAGAIVLDREPAGVSRGADERAGPTPVDAAVVPTEPPRDAGVELAAEAPDAGLDAASAAAGSRRPPQDRSRDDRPRDDRGDRASAGAATTTRTPGRPDPAPPPVDAGAGPRRDPTRLLPPD